MLQSFARKSQSTYGSFNTLNDGDDRNHGSAEAISTNIRDDESEDNDAEMPNESGGGDGDDDAGDAAATADDDDANKMDHDDDMDNATADEHLDTAEGMHDTEIEKIDTSDETNKEERK